MGAAREGCVLDTYNDNYVVSNKTFFRGIPMLKPRCLMQVLIILLLALALAPSASAGSKNFIQVTNGCDNTMWIYFKCYDTNPWESNACPSKNTKTTIAPGKNYTHKYEYSSVMTCKNIYVTYGRNDRSCDRCTKTLKAGFDKATPKLLHIQGNCTGNSLNFRMTPINGNVIN